MYRAFAFFVAFFILLPSAEAYTFFAQRARRTMNFNVLRVELTDGTVTSIPPGAQRVSMGVLRLSASCGKDISVRSIMLWHRGLGANVDIESVYAVSEGRRLTRGRQISSREGSVDLHIRNFVVPACRSREIRILADFSPDAAVTGEHRFELQRGMDIDADALVLVRKRSFSASRRTVGRVIGTISVTYLSLTEPIRYGPRQRLARFRLDANIIDHHLIRAITLTNNGSADDADIQNLFLESSRGERFTLRAPRMDGDQVRLVFDPPLILRKSRNRVFILRGDVRVGRSKTVQFVIEEPGDIESSPVSGRSIR